jgi:hypothetical protein
VGLLALSLSLSRRIASILSIKHFALIIDERCSVLCINERGLPKPLHGVHPRLVAVPIAHEIVFACIDDDAHAGGKNLGDEGSQIAHPIACKHQLQVDGTVTGLPRDASHAQRRSHIRRREASGDIREVGAQRRHLAFLGSAEETEAFHKEQRIHEPRECRSRSTPVPPVRGMMLARVWSRARHGR